MGGDWLSAVLCFDPLVMRGKQLAVFREVYPLSELNNFPLHK